MAGDRVSAFIEYVLIGVHNRREVGKRKAKPFYSIGRSVLTRVLGGQRLGSAQRDQLREICRDEGIGFAELSDRLIFFDPEDIERLTISLDGKEKRLGEATEYFAKMHRKAADEEWETHKFPEAD